MGVNKWPTRLLASLFPQRCRMCGLYCESALPLCPPCRQELPANRHCCPRCALPLPPTSGERIPCGACQANPPVLDHVLAPWIYDEQLALLIGRWKYAGEQGLTALLADLWLAGVATPPDVDLLVPVPLHWRKLLRRGYNQAALLAVALQARQPSLAGIRRDTRRATRTRATPPQSGTGARARRRNLAAAFTVNRPCDNLRIAIVDDVMTTGATAGALAQALRDAGAARVELWCLARTPAPQGLTHRPG